VERTNRVDALTGARALAGLYILIMHFGAPLVTRAPAWVRTARESGYLATSFFLMLSGFVLTVAYGRRFADGAIDRRQFLIQRIARLYPAYLLALVLMLPFACVHRWGEVTASFGDARLRWKLATALLHVGMAHVWFPRFATSWNVPGWCVSVEMWFYAAFPLAAAWAVCRRPRTLWLAAAASWATALGGSIAYTIARPDGFVADASSVGWYLSLYKFSPLSRLPELLFGVALGALYRQRRACPLRWPTAALIASVIAGALVVSLGDRIPYTLLHNGALLPLYGLVVWSLMAGAGPLHRALCWRPLVALGNASYPLYILQVPLMMWLVLVAGRQYGHGGQDAPFVAVALPLILAAAWATQRWLQPPAQRWLAAALARHWPAPPPMAAPLPATLPVATTPAAR
jgi:peptidoglycan/LPS O-acetylase OafA/YrhL